MKTTTLNKIIKEFEELSSEDKEYVADLFKKQLVESRREEIAERAKTALRNLEKGKVKKGTVKDLYKDLEND